MRKVIILLHLFLAAFLMFSKGAPPIKRAKLHFIASAPKQTTEFKALPAPASKTPVATAAQKKPVEKSKPTPPKPKATQKKELEKTPAKKVKETPSKEPKKKAIISDEVKAKELESLKKLESLLEELQAPPSPSPKKKSSSNRADLLKVTPTNPVSEGSSQVLFDGESFQELLFGELQLPQAGEVELEIEIDDGKLIIAKTIQSQSEENLAYLLKKIPQIELGNCKKIAGLENGMRLRIVFCAKQK